MTEIEIVPEFQDKKCRYLAIVIGFLFSFAPLILFGVVTLVYDIYFGFGTLIVVYIFISVYISKKRLELIPFERSEFNYSNFDIARFYVKREFCSDE